LRSISSRFFDTRVGFPNFRCARAAFTGNLLAQAAPLEQFYCACGAKFRDCEFGSGENSLG
jgi:hypothetical protein